MKFSFNAKIYKVGINPCVDVPLHITEGMIPVKGYIPVKGKMKDHLFTQTLVPVKNSTYRLYVNGLMLKGANANVGDELKFTIEQDAPITAEQIPMPQELKKQLSEKKLMTKFRALTAYRQKEILRYLNYLKTEEAVRRNVEKVVRQLIEL